MWIFPCLKAPSWKSTVRVPAQCQPPSPGNKTPYYGLVKGSWWLTIPQWGPSFLGWQPGWVPLDLRVFPLHDRLWWHCCACGTEQMKLRPGGGVEPASSCRSTCGIISFRNPWRIHGTGIFTYIWLISMANTGNLSYMDPMGKGLITIISSLVSPK